MTTVAYKDGIMVSDLAATTMSGHRIATVKKIFQAHGYTMGFAGDPEAVPLLLKWFTDEDWTPNAQLPYKLVDDEEVLPDNRIIFEVILVDQEGNVWTHFKGEHLHAVLDKEIAIGNGQQYARAAMALGFDAETAVVKASQFCGFTSEEVDIAETNNG